MKIKFNMVVAETPLQHLQVLTEYMYICVILQFDQNIISIYSLVYTSIGCETAS